MNVGRVRIRLSTLITSNYEFCKLDLLVYCWLFSFHAKPFSFSKFIGPRTCNPLIDNLAWEPSIEHFQTFLITTWLFTAKHIKPEFCCWSCFFDGLSFVCYRFVLFESYIEKLYFEAVVNLAFPICLVSPVWIHHFEICLA